MSLTMTRICMPKSFDIHSTSSPCWIRSVKKLPPTSCRHLRSILRWTSDLYLYHGFINKLWEEATIIYTYLALGMHHLVFGISPHECQDEQSDDKHRIFQAVFEFLFMNYCRPGLLIFKHQWTCANLILPVSEISVFSVVDTLSMDLALGLSG